MTRVGLLQAGYAGLGIAILCLAGTFSASLGWLVVLSPIVAVVAAFLLLFSQDDIPKWAGVAFLAYALVSLIAFLAATPATIKLSFWKGWANQDPSPIAQAFQDYLLLALPIMITATALVAAWEREHGARLLLAGALVGIIAVGGLTIVLDPTTGADGSSGDNATDDVLEADARARQQAGLLSVLLALSAAAGAASSGSGRRRASARHPRAAA